MSLDIVYGETSNQVEASRLAELVNTVVSEGTIYLGYPVLPSSDELIVVDALLVSSQCGLIAFIIANISPSNQEEWQEVVDQQDLLFSALHTHLSKSPGLRSGRQLAFVPQTVTVFPGHPVGQSPSPEGTYLALDEIPEWIQGSAEINEELERSIQGAIQRVSTIKPAKKRQQVHIDGSRGEILKFIERQTSNLDSWQKAAAIESPDGPQRIRGLAGSGKTVVLALKAALWHTKNPDWHIAVTFESRSLYQQFDDLLNRFTFEYSNDVRDPERLKVVHSWGSRTRPGLYSAIADALGETPRDFSYASGTYGRDRAFQGICQELLTIATARPEPPDPIFDAVLIDEAQDLPPEFFRLVYMFTREPKRIVWGYDELQKLSETAMPTTDELFGYLEGGEPAVSIVNAPGQPRRDVVLQVCYRNTPWALALAHAIGIGVYRSGGLVQSPDLTQLWIDIGYEVVGGELNPGSNVTLKRSSRSFPSYFSALLIAEDAVVVKGFETELAQDSWIARQIQVNLNSDELEADDILIVLPDTFRAKSRAPRLMETLQRLGIQSHLAGVNTSVDEIFRPGSVALAHIYRAKGNEAPMVYCIDAQYAASTINAITRRNILFTGITRSRAWIRICGWGPEMATIEQEANTVISRNFELQFDVPTAPELAELRYEHRERRRDTERSIRKASQRLTQFLEGVERDDVDIRDLPEQLRFRLREKLQADDSDDIN
jgi:superfamily I DNA and RNA helicase